MPTQVEISSTWRIPIDSATPSNCFEDLARAGNILYAGLSDFAVWPLAHAATLSELTHTLPIAEASFEHSLIHRRHQRTALARAAFDHSAMMVVDNPALRAVGSHC